MSGRIEPVIFGEYQKWCRFLEYTASVLRMNIILLKAGVDAPFSVYEACPSCGRLFGPAAPDDEILRLDDMYSVAVQDCSCGNGGDAWARHEKIILVKGLLTEFYGILNNPLPETQHIKEIAPLHKISHIVLSLLRGNDDVLSDVIGLCLSTAELLFDAACCRIQTDTEEYQHIFAKHNRNLFPDNQGTHLHKLLTVEINSRAIHGTMVIDSPDNLKNAAGYLDFMIEECITALETAQLLKMMDSKLAVILDSVDSMVLLVGRRQDICYANIAASKLLGRPFYEIIARPLNEINILWSQCIEAVPDGITARMKDSLMSASDETFIDWEVQPLIDNDEILGWFIKASDRTDYYRLQELAEKTANLVQATTLLKVTAHEIRNPLATFTGLLKIIDKKGNSPEISKYVSIGMNEIKKLSLLLDEFSQFGKEAAVSLEITDMKMFMDDVLTLVNAGFNGPDIEIISSLETVKPVLADQRQLTQAIFNLVKNAYEALYQQGKIMIYLSQHDENWVEINISDNGPGISDSIKDKLFKPYFSTKEGGSGLGLAITSSIISSHKGKISVCNLADGGACFSILLPSCITKSEQRTNSTNILIVSNDEFFRKSSEQVFRDDTIRVNIVSRSDSVYKTIEKVRPHAILIDDRYLAARILSKMVRNISRDYPSVKILIAGDGRQKYGGNVIRVEKPLDRKSLSDAVKSIIK